MPVLFPVYSSVLWPIHILIDDHARSIVLDKGDMMIYKGCEIPHWRERLFDGQWLQLFLHYVDGEGTCQEHKFDKRPGLGPY